MLITEEDLLIGYGIFLAPWQAVQRGAISAFGRWAARRRDFEAERAAALRTYGREGQDDDVTL